MTVRATTAVVLITAAMATSLVGGAARAAGASCVPGSIRVFGTVSNVSGSDLTIATRDGTLVQFDTAQAKASGQIRPVELPLLSGPRLS